MPNRNKKSHRGQGDRGRGRGRGRGGPNAGVPTTVVAPPASHAPRHSYPNASASTDVVTQRWPEPSESPHATVGGANGNTNTWRGPWRNRTQNLRSGAGTPLRGFDSPRRGSSTPRGVPWRGRGRGRGQDPFHSSRNSYPGGGFKTRPILGKDASFSNLLYTERPLLRPVHFVRATMTPFLFEEAEDVLKPPASVTDTQKASTVSTTDRVARFLHGTGLEFVPELESESESEDDALEEIDFADLAQVRAEIDAIASNGATMSQKSHKDNERNNEEVKFAHLMAMRAEVDAVQAQARVTVQDAVVQETHDRSIDATQLSSLTADNANDNRSHGVQELASSYPTLDESLNPKPFIEILNPSGHESVAMQNAIAVEGEVEEPAISTIQPVPTSTDVDIPLHPNPLSGDDTHPLFVIDSAPSRPLSGHSASDVILIDRIGHGATLGDEEEERIVYVAPHPRSGRASPVPALPRVKLPRTSMLTGWPVEVDTLRSPVREENATTMFEHCTRADFEADARKDHEGQDIVPGALEDSPFASSSMHVKASHPQLSARKTHKKEMPLQRQRQRQKKRGRSRFGAFGAIMSEALLNDEDVKEMHHPRWETRRRGDSDLDWGTEDDGKDEGKEDGDEMGALSEGLGGMDIDPDLEIDMDAMQGFLKSMSVEGSRFVTIDDIEDEARMEREDEQSHSCGEGSSASERSDDEELVEEGEVDDDDDGVFNVEEENLIGESDSAEVAEDSSEDNDGLSPKSSFEARLHKLRERSRCQDRNPIQETSEGEEDEEDLITYINDLLDKNSQVLSGRDRKQKKAVFRNLHQDYLDQSDSEVFLDDPEYTTPVNKKKGKKGKGKQATGHFAAELEAQWSKDRAKKAEYKRQRQDAHLLTALDPLSAAASGSRGVSRKAMRAAAQLDPAAALAIAPWAVIDVPSLVAQIRRFAENIEASSFTLPPMYKVMRKCVHEMACLFGISSVSKGKGKSRYTTLYRTSRTALAVNEGKVKALIKRYGSGDWGGGKVERVGKSEKGGKGKEVRGDKGQRMLKPREGDEVGKEAPKIGESNIGFKMLALMGWSEGDRIGGSASVGLEAPLTAIIKNTKLGLGAAK